MAEETPMPVFFTQETDEVAQIYDDVSRSVHNDQAGSAAEGNTCSITSLNYVANALNLEEGTQDSVIFGTALDTDSNFCLFYYYLFHL
jgi:hypothetical protein